MDNLFESNEEIKSNALSLMQHTQLTQLKENYKDIIQDVPGRTCLVHHDILRGNSPPIRLPPYRLAHTAQEVLREEIKSLLEQNIIEPSKSPWSAPLFWYPMVCPIVLVPHGLPHCSGTPWSAPLFWYPMVCPHCSGTPWSTPLFWCPMVCPIVLAPHGLPPLFWYPMVCPFVLVSHGLPHCSGTPGLPPLFWYPMVCPNSSGTPWSAPIVLLANGLPPLFW